MQTQTKVSKGIIKLPSNPPSLLRNKTTTLFHPLWNPIQMGDYTNRSVSKCPEISEEGVGDRTQKLVHSSDTHLFERVQRFKARMKRPINILEWTEPRVEQTYDESRRRHGTWWHKLKPKQIPIILKSVYAWIVYYTNKKWFCRHEA